MTMKKVLYLEGQLECGKYLRMVRLVAEVCGAAVWSEWELNRKMLSDLYQGSNSLTAWNIELCMNVIE